MVSDAAASRRFLFDTNIFIELGERYPEDVFKGLWETVLRALSAGEIVTCHGVVTELKKGPTPAAPWRAKVYAACKEHLVDEADASIQTAFGRISQLIEDGALSKSLTDVDQLVLACGEALNLPVVTRDAKMRSACEAGKVPTRALDLPAFFREMGWEFA
jgi:predicted nucleic acid-binding protein